MEFQNEALSPELFAEMLPLFQVHYHEIAHFKDIPLDPDYERYRELYQRGVLRIFTARKDAKLIGYAVFFVARNLHYSTSLQAVQDILFIEPGKRGTGGRFIKWCDEELRKESVQAVYHHVKKAHNFGPMLERFGYELVDLIYVKPLDKMKGAA